MEDEDRRTTMKGLHTIVLDENESPLKIEVELGAGMNDMDYIAWNVAGAIKTIQKKPNENEITLAVYKLHRGVLQRRGANEADLAEGDRLLKQYTGIEVSA